MTFDDASREKPPGISRKDREYYGATLTHVYTVLALTAFAANSILCRMALGGRAIDAASFTTIRLVSGAAMLFTISRLRSLQQPSELRRGKPEEAIQQPSELRRGQAEEWVHESTVGGRRSVTALFAYAIAFSFAYLSLTTGTGALILFGAVQTTMLIAALSAGERPRPLEWIALVSAIVGLVVLVFPGLSAPPILGSVLMATAGISWGFYSLWGRGTKNPLEATTLNFVRAVPLAVVASVIAITVIGVQLTSRGVMLAVASGTLASGLGYVIWYAALRGLSATRAATVQLAVPVIAAIGGVLFLSERVSTRLVVAAVMILGGIGLATVARRRN